MKKTFSRKNFALLAALTTLITASSAAYAGGDTRHGDGNGKNGGGGTGGDGPSSLDRHNRRSATTGIVFAEGDDLEDCITNLIDDVLFSYVWYGRRTINHEDVNRGYSTFSDAIRNVTPVSDGYTFDVTLRRFYDGFRRGDNYDVYGWIRLHSHGQLQERQGSDLEGWSEEYKTFCSIKLNRDSRTPLVNLSLRNSLNQVILTLGQGMEPNTLP